MELVENVLKENSFNNEDWERLGEKLGIHYIGQEYIDLDNSSMLKECLIGWLTSSGATGYFLWFRVGPPTLYDLADALKSIGYSEAGEYIIKTCKLIIMFNDQCY